MTGASGGSCHGFIELDCLILGRKFEKHALCRLFKLAVPILRFFVYQTPERFVPGAGRVVHDHASPCSVGILLLPDHIDKDPAKLLVPGPGVRLVQQGPCVLATVQLVKPDDLLFV